MSTIHRFLSSLCVARRSPWGALVAGSLLLGAACLPAQAQIGSATPVLQKPMAATTFSLSNSCETLRPWSGLAASSLMTSSSGRPR